MECGLKRTPVQPSSPFTVGWTFTRPAPRPLSSVASANAMEVPVSKLPFDPNFFDRAACKNMETTIFFTERGAHSTKAKKTCSACPVCRDCLEYALTVPGMDDYGVFGGKSPDERAAIIRKRGGRGHPELSPFHVGFWVSPGKPAA